ncbi:isochorismatase family cysteine hydrolase [Novosphingobium rosa]|uniref:isochorismatase family cysteine hydrolase n=1 Tax=Novosphingobium rosa TaxID=76978 RepID=UPI000AA0A118|nr:cysteine hydrolase family protein [Novosphingobium rosa]
MVSRSPLPVSREIACLPGETALLFIDAQRYNCSRKGGQFAGLSAAEIEERYGFFFAALEGGVIERWARLQAAFRERQEEVLYTVMESLTRDGRDRSLDYKISGFNIPRGNPDAQMLPQIMPGEDEIVLPKSSCSVFMSTNIDYLLRNLQVRSLVIAGVLTDQCVDSAIRDACDLGYLVTVVTDACATHSAERHDWSLRNNRGFCRQITTDAMIAELSARA